MRFELVSYLKGTVMRGREKVPLFSLRRARKGFVRGRRSEFQFLAPKMVVKCFAPIWGVCEPQTLGAGLTPKQKVLTLAPRLPLPRFAAIRGLAIKFNRTSVLCI